MKNDLIGEVTITLNLLIMIRMSKLVGYLMNLLEGIIIGVGINVKTFA